MTKGPSNNYRTSAIYITLRVSYRGEGGLECPPSRNLKIKDVIIAITAKMGYTTRTIKKYSIIIGLAECDEILTLTMSKSIKP